MKRGPIRGHRSRSRSLNDFNKKFRKNAVQRIIENALKNGKKVRVLEIGCGEGRVLMELRKKFSAVEFYGINKKPWLVMKGSQSLKATAIHHKILTKSELKKINYPKIYFYNAKKLKFKDNYFDLIISQVSLQYVDRKDLLLEEVWRVLKKGGKALLHLDTYHKTGPDFMELETPRFIIYNKGRLLTVRRLIQQVRKKGFDIAYNKADFPDISRTLIICNKNKSAKLKLNLKFDELSSFDLSELDLEKKNTDIFWGFRSVYRI